MSDESVSLAPILDGIHDVYEQLSRVPRPESLRDEAELVRLRNVLEAIEGMVTALCTPDTPGGEVHIPPILRLDRTE